MTTRARRPGAFSIRLACTLCAVVMASPVLSQAPKDSREREALKRAQQTVQKLQQEKIEAERARDELAAKVAALSAQLEKEKKTTLESGKHTASALRDANLAREESKTLQSRLETADRLVAERTDERRKLEQTLGESQTRWDTERAALQASLAQENERVSSCEAKNAKLANVATQLLKNYDHKGIWSALIDAEPITGIGRVETESLLQEYRDRIDDHRIGTTSPPAGR